VSDFGGLRHDLVNAAHLIPLAIELSIGLIVASVALDARFADLVSLCRRPGRRAARAEVTQAGGLLEQALPGSDIGNTREAAMEPRKHALSIALGTLAHGPAVAQNWTALLKNTPAELFDSEDLRLFKDADRRALNGTPVGSSVSWANPKTGSHGELSVVSDFTWQTHPCRRIKVVNEARDRKGSSTPSLCRVDGRWKAVSASQLHQ